MKKTMPLGFPALLVAGSLLTACSDNSNDVKNDRPVTFLNNVVDAGELYFSDGSRSFGRVSYGTFGNGIMLEEGTRELVVKDENDEDRTDTITVLENVSFTVKDQDNAHIVALSGSLADQNLELHSLHTTIDKASFAYSGNADLNDDLIYINVANIHPEYPSLKVYFLSGDESLETAVADAEVAYGKDSDAIILESAKQTIKVVDTGTGNVVFDAGERELNDEVRQMLIFGQSPSDASDLVTYYYYGSTLNSDQWSNGDGEAQVRFFNGIAGQTLEQVATTVSDETKVLATALESGMTSSFETLPVGHYDFLLDFTDPVFGSGEAAYTYLGAGREYTVVLYPVFDSWDRIALEYDGRAIATKARVGLVNLEHVEEDETAAAYNVHLTAENNNTELTRRIPEVEGIKSGTSVEIEKRVSVNDTEGRVYTLRVMNESNTKLIDSMTLTLKSGSYMQLALMDVNGKLQLENLTTTAVDAP